MIGVLGWRRVQYHRGLLPGTTNEHYIFPAATGGVVMWEGLGGATRVEKGQHVGEKPMFWDLKTIVVGRSLNEGDDDEKSELEGWQGIMVCIFFGSFNESLTKSILSRSLSKSDRMSKDRWMLRRVAQMRALPIALILLRPITMLVRFWTTIFTGRQEDLLSKYRQARQVRNLSVGWTAYRLLLLSRCRVQLAATFMRNLEVLPPQTGNLK